MLLAVPASAVAAPYVPPGNSAATQYTEAVPTAGGPKATGESRRGKGKAPNKVLGSRNTERLDSQGAEGRAAAEVAAATAPQQIGGGEPAPQRTQGGGSGSGQVTGGGGASSPGHRASNGGGVGPAPESSPQPQSSTGSSGLGEVVGQATGASSSNPLGLLLPLLIVAVLVWSVAYFLRQRRRPTG